MRIPAILLLLVLAAPAHAQKAFGANGLELGAAEEAVKRVFPVAHCKPLEWKTTAADRRCDDAKIVMHGVPARITLYLKANAVVAFDVVLDHKDLERFVAGLKGEYGAPKAETREIAARKGDRDRQVYKVLWEAGPDRAALTALSDKKRVQLEVSRGNFADEVYRVR